jgi:hypothetical protein
MPSSIIPNPANPDDDFKVQQKLMRKDARVKLSQEATSHGLNAKRGDHRRRIEGTIISPLPVQQIVTVLWDGRTKAESWHVDLLEKLAST